MRNLNNLDLTRLKNVIVRVDYNVPINSNFIIQDFTRISRSKKTLDLLIKGNCKILLLAHFGRPDGMFVERLSFSNIIDQISNNLEQSLNFISYDNFKNDGLSKYHDANRGIFLLDNIRFFEEEKANDVFFSKIITKDMDLFVNEAFSASHRNHASVDQMAKNILSYPGFNFYKEAKIISSIKKSSVKTFAIIGGSKVSTKIEALLSLVKSCSDIFIGGAMANNFLKHQKINVSNSLIEKNIETKIKNILNEALKYNCKIHLPEDVILDSEQEFLTSNLEDIKNFRILDVGPLAVDRIKNLTEKSDLVLWNGPLGYIENKKFAKGSIDIAKILSKSKPKVIIGGGDTLLAINIANQNFNDFYFISTAGGAFLDALEDKILPGIKALTIQ